MKRMPQSTIVKKMPQSTISKSRNNNSTYRCHNLWRWNSQQSSNETTYKSRCHKKKINCYRHKQPKLEAERIQPWMMKEGTRRRLQQINNWSTDQQTFGSTGQRINRSKWLRKIANRQNKKIKSSCLKNMLENTQLITIVANYVFCCLSL